MNLNATLFGEMITFMIFVWFTMKFVWPQLARAIAARQKTIADGLAAAHDGQEALQKAQLEVQARLREASDKARQLLEQAEKRAGQLLDDAREQSKQDAERIINAAREDVLREIASARLALRSEVAAIAVSGASKILGASIDEQQNARLLSELAEELT